MKVQSPLEVYNYLPGTNCKECGEETCMAFASKLIDRSKTLDMCKEILDEAYKEEYEKLEDMLSPEIKEIIIGVGDKAVKVGGEDVLYRHQLTFYNQPPFAYDVTDVMSEKEITERVNFVNNYKKFYVGNFLRLDMIAIRSVSDDPEKFKECVKKVKDLTELPIILMSFNPDVLDAGLEIIKDRRPLVYAANEDNWQKVAELIDKYKVPVVLFSPDLDKLSSLAKTFVEMGMDELVLDPGTYPSGKQLMGTFERFIKLRRSAIKDGNKDVAFPLIGIPAISSLISKDKDEFEQAVSESILTILEILKYGDLLVFHNIAPYAILPAIHLRFNIYTDPRSPVQVDAGLFKMGNPDENSPLFLTTNFALTYFTVKSDLESNNIDSYLLVVNTDGIGVEASVAGGQLNTGKIKDAIETTKAKEVIKHNTLVLPGLAARLSGATEDETGMKVLVGPTDSGRIAKWMEDHWESDK
ncbi:MAG: acetyl-CoA decarbonylase/synthase complex subunit gamma [Candidatus Methanoliparum thermophilum]|uniref:Acetyl-CoA decarbonylase/synthase complex subunit gamma n=1 Tax=Methanoliparum thermophilum TaxID=2491083 RepID=A0A520KRX5_METT2|nr:acetyl-CoA decarbonylase/synthase complex subunit gamma [Candidatus Methanoliparum sp. LAM-1]RZN64544.1 MAG: acetyl-CoA decarbonylase/synthase complex subunit gamma [Candidatus Methanoliparum thermophilum]BDC35858.1 acetyl-CoA synthase subunit E [Candidatus Methanoliparum sp. LAM-1]